MIIMPPSNNSHTAATMESLRNKSPINMMKTIKKASPAPPRGGGTSSKKSPATIKAVTRFLDSASTVVWEGVKEGANLTNVVATKMSQTVVKNNDAQRDHYNRGSGDGDMTRTHSSPITTHGNNSKSATADGGGGGVKERIKIFNSTTTATPPKKNSRSHASSMNDNNNSPYQRRMGGGVSGEQRRREYEASIPLPTPIPLPVRCSTGMAANSYSSPYVRDERGGGGGSDGNGNKRRDNRRSPPAVSASTTTTTTMNNGRYNNRRHDHYEKENDTNSTTATTTSNSKRMYHAGLDNFVSVLKSSSPKKLRKQNEVNKAKEEEGEGRITHHCQPKDCHNNDKRVSKNKNGWRHDDDDDDHGTDEKQLSSGANNYENHADNDTAKARQDQCINIRVMKKNKCDNGISPIKPWQDDAYLAISSDANDSHSVTMEGNNDNNYDSSSSSKMKKKKQRMGVNNNYTSSIPYTSDMRYQHHSLIQIPLQRHIMAVHESACSNATCTVMKEPFPLVLLSSSRQVGEEDDDHLDVLGAIAGHGSINNSVIGNNDNRIKKDGNNDNDKKIALDLLTSAAFLFKTSRRKIL